MARYGPIGGRVGRKSQNPHTQTPRLGHPNSFLGFIVRATHPRRNPRRGQGESCRRAQTGSAVPARACREGLAKGSPTLANPARMGHPRGFSGSRVGHSPKASWGEFLHPKEATILSSFSFADLRSFFICKPNCAAAGIVVFAKAVFTVPT